MSNSITSLLTVVKERASGVIKDPHSLEGNCVIHVCPLPCDTCDLRQLREDALAMARVIETLLEQRDFMINKIDSLIPTHVGSVQTSINLFNEALARAFEEGKQASDSERTYKGEKT